MERGRSDCPQAADAARVQRIAPHRRPVHGSAAPDADAANNGAIHEAYLRMASVSGGQWVNRDHFFAVAAKAMRHILVDHARAKHAARRGGQERQAVPLEEAAVICAQPCKEILALDDALKTLETLSPRQSQVVELRYFGGLSNEQIAETLKISPETVVRDWRAAKAWLFLELQGSGASCAQSAP